MFMPSQGNMLYNFNITICVFPKPASESSFLFRLLFYMFTWPALSCLNFHIAYYFHPHSFYANPPTLASMILFKLTGHIWTSGLLYWLFPLLKSFFSEVWIYPCDSFSMRPALFTISFKMVTPSLLHSFLACFLIFFPLYWTLKI